MIIRISNHVNLEPKFGLILMIIIDLSDVLGNKLSNSLLKKSPKFKFVIEDF